MRVISDLFGQYVGGPILVIGGGPSVTADLEKLQGWWQLRGFAPRLVLSANEHGCKQDRFPVDYIVHCDKVHCFRHANMAEYLRQFGKPLISRWATADVRLEDWNFSGNSGTTAVAVAAALGGSPIVVTGIDFWNTGRKYFHDNETGLTAAQSRLARKPIISNPDRRLNRLAQFVGDAHVRPMSGLMTGRWPTYDPLEKFGAAPVIPYTARVRRSMEYRALRSFHWSNHDTVQTGTVLKLTKSEAAPLLFERKVEAIESPV